MDYLCSLKLFMDKHTNTKQISNKHIQTKTNTKQIWTKNITTRKEIMPKA